MYRTHGCSNGQPAGIVHQQGRAADREQYILPISANMYTRSGESTGRYSLNPYRVEKENEQPLGITELVLPDGMRSGTLTDRYCLESRETMDKLSFTSSKPGLPKSQYLTDRTNPPTQRLSIITLPDPHPTASSASPSLSKLTSVLGDIWLMVFNTPFNAHSHNQVYQVCSAIYTLQQNEKNHQQFIERLKDLVGGDGMDEEELLERCREMVECLMRMDGIKEEMQIKMQQYIDEIEGLGRVVEGVMAEKEGLQGVVGMLEERNRGLVEEVRKARRDLEVRRIQEVAGRLSFDEPQNLEQENHNLRNLLANSQLQKNELLQTIERDVEALKQAIQQLVGEKIDLIRKLIEAQNYIKLLRSSTQSQTTQLKQYLQAQRRISASLYKTPRLRSPEIVKNPSPVFPSPKMNINEQLEQFLSDETVQKEQIVKRWLQGQKTIDELAERIAMLEELIRSLEEGLNFQRHGREQIEHEAYGLKVMLQEQQNSINNMNNSNPNTHRSTTSQTIKKQKHELLMFFQDLLGSLVVRCAEQNLSSLGEQILHLVRIVQQKRIQDAPSSTYSSTSNLLAPPASTLTLTSPRPTPPSRSPFSSPLMLSPQMAYLKASKSVQKLALKSDDVCVFHMSVEKLFEQFKGYAHPLLLEQLMRYVKELNLYPYHANLFAFTERLIDGLKGMTVPEGMEIERELQVRLGLEKMAVVFGEVEQREGRLATVPEERGETGGSGSNSPSLANTRNLECEPAHTNMEDLEYQQIQAIRDQIKILQDQAEQLRQSLNYCLTETIESPKRVRQHIQVIDYQ